MFMGCDNSEHLCILVAWLQAFMLSGKSTQPILPTKIFGVVHKMPIVYCLLFTADSSKLCIYTQMRTSISAGVRLSWLLSQLFGLGPPSAEVCRSRK